MAERKKLVPGIHQNGISSGRRYSLWRIVSIAAFVTALKTLSPSAEMPSASAALGASGMQGGFCVVVGTVDGELEASLIDGGRVQVQGLALTPEHARAARLNLFGKGLYPVASVTYESSVKTLPYTDRLVNLLIADLDALGDKAPSLTEIDRVLAYEGVAYIRQSGIWTSRRKDTPDDIYRYTHWKGDSTVNSYQRDYRAGLPNQVRWIGAPTYGLFNRNGDGTNVMESERVTGGAWMGLFGGAIHCRDAFSGVLLWRNELDGEDRNTACEQAGGEMFAANDNRLFALQAKPGGSLVACNIRTGALEKRYDKGPQLRSYIDNRGNEKLNWWDANLMGLSQTLLHEGRVVQLFGNSVYCYNEENEQIEWKWTAAPDSTTIIRSGVIQDSVLTVAVTYRPAEIPDTLGSFYTWNKSSDRGYKADLKRVVGLRLNDGEELWSIDEFPGSTGKFHELIAGGGGRVFAVLLDRLWEHCIDVHNGKILWSNDKGGTGHYNVGSYRGNITVLAEENLVVFGNHGGYASHNLSTGVRVGGMKMDYWGSCPGATVTPNYLIASMYFTPFSNVQKDLSKREDSDFKFVSIGGSACNVYPIVAYGSYYQMGGRCSCRRALPAQSCAQAVQPVAYVSDGNRLGLEADGGLISEKLERQTQGHQTLIGSEWGPASFGEYIPRSDMTCDWKKPHSRFKFLSSGEQYKHWKNAPSWTGLAQEETSPVQAGDLTLTAIVHEHRLTATRGGEVLWNYVAGSRISHRPEVDGNRAYFGSHDGYVYAVNLTNGSTAWKFMAAPAESRMNAWNQIESCWPVFGVVLDEGKLYATAGRLATLDGGIHAYCLDAETGEILWHVRNVSGYATEELTNNPPDHIKECDPQLHPDMAAIRGMTISYALNDVPYLENGWLKVHDWFVDISNPSDTILYGESLPVRSVIPRSEHENGIRHRDGLGTNMEVRNGLLYIRGLKNKSFKVGVNDAMGRSVISLSKEDTYRVDVGLRDLPDGIYFVWLQADGRKQVAKVKLLSGK